MILSNSSLSLGTSWFTSLFWIYLLIVVGAFLIPIVVVWRNRQGAYFDASVISEIKWIKDEHSDIKTRLELHFNREKAYWDYLRRSILLYTGAQTYVALFSTIDPIVLTALSTAAPTTEPYARAFLTLVSLHLAITLGLYKAFRVERGAQKGLEFEHEFYNMFYQFQDRSDDFEGLDEAKAVDRYFKKYSVIRQKAYRGELDLIPGVHEEANQPAQQQEKKPAQQQDQDKPAN